MTKSQTAELEAMLKDLGLNAKQRTKVKTHAANMMRASGIGIDWATLLAFIKAIIDMFK